MAEKAAMYVYWTACAICGWKRGHLLIFTKDLADVYTGDTEVFVPTTGAERTRTGADEAWANVHLPHGAKRCVPCDRYTMQKSDEAPVVDPGKDFLDAEVARQRAAEEAHQMRQRR